ncbi:MAG: hypothetical protein K6A63_07025 [Acholeplasmatales bacterium]|nr:hypothetical protein [Acholeplasmatales bacterium]
MKKENDYFGLRQVTSGMPGFYSRTYPTIAIILAIIFPPLGLGIGISATVASKRELGKYSGLAIFSIVLAGILMVAYMVLIIFIVLIASGVL